MSSRQWCSACLRTGSVNWKRVPRFIVDALAKLLDCAHREVRLYAVKAVASHTSSVTRDDEHGGLDSREVRKIAQQIQALI